MLEVILTIVSAAALLAEQAGTDEPTPGDELAYGDATSGAGERWAWRIIAGDGTPGLGPLHGQILHPPGLWDDATIVDSDDDLEALRGRLEATIAGLGPALD